MTRRLPLVLLVCVLATFQTFSAHSTVDQSYKSRLSSHLTIEPDNQLAQTFTVGLSGFLTGIDLAIGRETTPSASGDTVISVLPAPGGTPSSSLDDAVATVTVPASQWAFRDSGEDWTFYRHIDLPAQVAVTAGDQLAIVVRQATGLVSDIFYWYGGDEFGGYPSGAAYSRNGSGAWVETTGFDVSFATYVGSAFEAPCVYRFASGKGSSSIAYCVSANGTIVGFEAPVGQEHLRVGEIFEGYVVCRGIAVQSWDLSASADGFGAPVVVAGPSSTGVTIRRSSAQFQLDQIFKLDKGEKALTITMTLTNIGGGPLIDVRLARAFDPDVDGDYGDDTEVRSARGTWAGDNQAIALTAITWGTSAETAIETGSVPACSPTGATAPSVTTGDANLATVTYHLGNLAAGAKRKVQFVYRAQ